MKAYFLAIILFAWVLSACGVPATPTLEQAVPVTAELVPTNTPFPVLPTETPLPQVPESAAVQPDVDDKLELFSSDQLGLCFSYPKGYLLDAYDDHLVIMGLNVPGVGDYPGYFSFEIGEAYDRTAKRIADEELDLNVTQIGLPADIIERWTVTIGGEQAEVLDGLPGQDLQRKAYVVRGQGLYIFTFTPVRSQYQAADDQVQALYDTVTSSWAWSACTANQ